MTYAQVLRELRDRGAEKVARTLELAVQTEEKKAGNGDKNAVALTVERVLSTEIDAVRKGKPVTLPGRYLHLDGVVEEAGQALRERPQPLPQVPRSVEVRAERITREESPDTFAALEMAVSMDGGSLVVGSDGGKFVVTVWLKGGRSVTAIGESLTQAFTDAATKFMQLS
jgi:hypothetical protein